MGTYTDLIKLQPQLEEKQEEIKSGEVAKSPHSQMAKRLHGEVAKTPSGEIVISPEPRSPSRKVKRQGVDIYEDQLFALAEIQTALYQRDKRKPSTRELTLAAFDEYIKKMKLQLGLK